jgi:YspA, cpYpsA-related SLOG family
MGQPFRLLVTGSRTWDDTTAIEQVLAVILARHPEGVLLVHGACPRGADAIAAAYAAQTPGYQVEAHPANWHRYGRAASPGSTSAVRLARAAGIPVWLRTQP